MYIRMYNDWLIISKIPFNYQPSGDLKCFEYCSDEIR